MYKGKKDLLKNITSVPVKIGRYRKELPVGIYRGSIIDIETTGAYPENDEIMTLGYLEFNKSNNVHMLQRIEATASEYYESFLTC